MVEGSPDHPAQTSASAASAVVMSAVAVSTVVTGLIVTNIVVTTSVITTSVVGAASAWSTLFMTAVVDETAFVCDAFTPFLG